MITALFLEELLVVILTESLGHIFGHADHFKDHSLKTYLSSEPSQQCLRTQDSVS